MGAAGGRWCRTCCISTLASLLCRLLLTLAGAFASCRNTISGNSAGVGISSAFRRFLSVSVTCGATAGVLRVRSTIMSLSESLPELFVVVTGCCGEIKAVELAAVGRAAILAVRAIDIFFAV